MPVSVLPLRLLAALCLSAMCALTAGCADRQGPSAAPDGNAPAAAAPDAGSNGTGSTNAAPTADQPLPHIQVRKGQTVHVSVSGGDSSFNADLESMLTSYLQSEREMVPADSPQKADLLVRIKVEDVYPLGSSNSPVSAKQALGSTAGGAVLGVLLGGATGGRQGAAWGAGGGALVGLGAALLDSRGASKIWGMKALVGMGHNGKEPDGAEMRRLTIRAEGEHMNKEEILPALEDTLSRKILDSLRS